MPLRRYSPSPARIREEYARECARRALRQRQKLTQKGEDQPARAKIPSNSEPWLAEPKSVAELWEIAQRVQETATKWAPPA